MTANEFMMYPFIYNYLCKKYSEKQGWNIANHDKWYDSDPFYIIERKSYKLVQRAVVIVTEDNVITDKEIKKINELISSLAGDNIRIVEIIMAVNKGTNISKIPIDINILYLESSAA